RSVGLAPVRFFESGHGPPLLRYFEQLLLDVGVGHLSSVIFAFARLGQILLCSARHCRRPVRSLVTNVTGEESFHQTAAKLKTPEACTLWSPGGRTSGLGQPGSRTPSGGLEKQDPRRCPSTGGLIALGVHRTGV